MQTTSHSSVHTQERGAPTVRAVAELKERIGTLFASPNFQPPVLPEIAVELLDVNRYPDIDLRRVARMIERDPLLAGRVMQMVQSPFFAGRVPVYDLNQAIFRLGLDTIRDLVLEAALNIRVFATPGYQQAMQRIRLHSVATAHIGRIIAKETHQDHHRIFLLGLLHDVGLAAGLITVDNMLRHRPPVRYIWPAIETTHGAAGTLLARMGIAGDLARLIGHHHHYKAPVRTNWQWQPCTLQKPLPTRVAGSSPGPAAVAIVSRCGLPEVVASAREPSDWVNNKSWPASGAEEHWTPFVELASASQQIGQDIHPVPPHRVARR